MSNPSPRPISTASSSGTANGQSAKEAASDVADHGKQAAGDVAATGKQAAQDVAEQTKQQASDLLGATRQQLGEQVEVQQSAIVDTLRSLGDQLAAMTENTTQDGTAIDVAGKARDRTRGAADWLDERDPGQVLDELRRLGRERPGAFLLGAAVAGVVAGRLTRGAVAVHTDDADPHTVDPQPVIAAPEAFGTQHTNERPAPGRHEALRQPGVPGGSDVPGLYGSGGGIAP